MKTLIANGTTLRYEDEGQGHAIVFLHAFPLHSRMWMKQLLPLSDTFRVIAMDARGFGGAMTKVNVITIEQIAEDAVQLMKKLSVPRAVFCGHSLGAYAALELTKRHPELVRGLLLSGVRPAPDPSEPARWEKFERQAKLDGHDFVVREIARPFLTKDHDPEVRHSLRKMIFETELTALLAAGRGLLRRPDFTKLLKGSPAPVTFVAGADDAVIPAAQAEAIAAAAGAELVKVDGAGHLPMMEKPDAFTAAVASFMEAVATRRRRPGT